MERPAFVERRSQLERRRYAQDGTVRRPEFAEAGVVDLFQRPRSVESETHLAERPVNATRLHFGSEHLAIAQRISASGSAEIDLAQGTAVWTEEMFRISGRPVAALAPSLVSFIAQVHPEDRDWVFNSVLSEVGGTAVPSFEFRLLRPDGEIRWLRRHSELRRDQSGKPILIVEAYHDLTERKKLEAALRASDEAQRFGKKHLDLAQRVARVGSIVRDLRTREVEWSDELYRLLGYEPGEMEPSHERYMARVHPDDRAAVKAMSDSAWAGREVQPVEYRIRLPDGSIRWVRREAAVTRDERGHPRLSVSTVIDITDQKRMEAELQRREEHLVLAQQTARVGSIERDFVTGATVISDELYRLLDYRPGEVPATLENFLKRVHPDDVATVRALHEASWAGDPTPPAEYRLVRPSGEIRWIHREAAVTRDAEGRPMRGLSTFMDVTERKRLETELRDSAENLRRSQDHLQRAQSLGLIGSSELDLRGGTRIWSKEYFHVLGLDPATATPGFASFTEAVLPEDRHKLISLDAMLADNGPIEPVELRVRRDGEIRWLRRQIEVTRDQEGKPTNILFSLQDITEQKRMETALTASADNLRRSQVHLERAQNLGLIGSCELDVASDEQKWSEEYFRLLGLDPATARPGAETVVAAILPEDRPKLIARDALLTGQGLFEPAELRVRRDGEIHWLRRLIDVTRDAQGKPISILFTLQDITAHKRMEAALIDSAENLRLSREHLQRAQRAARVGSIEVDLRTKTIVWSDEFYRLLGYRAGEVEATRENFLIRVHPDDVERVRALGYQPATEEDVRSDEFRILLPSGEIRWVHRRAETERDENGTAIRVLRTYRDITERRHMESVLIAYADELRSNREHLVRAQSAGRIGSAEFNLNGNVIFWSDELWRILGVEQPAVPSMAAFYAQVHPEDRDRVRAAGDRLLAGKPVDAATFRVVRPDGEVRWLRRVAEPVRNGYGKPVSFVATIIDVTDARRAEEDRAKLQEHLAHAQKLDSLGALSGGIAHDFNNLLTTILGGVSLLRDDAMLSSEARKLAHSVVRATQQGAELTRRLLSFGRRQMLTPVVIDLAQVARDLETILRRTLGGHLAITIRPAADLWMAKADRSQFEAAVINLAVNARDAMPDGGNLTIEVVNRTVDDAFLATHAGAVRGDYVAISVTDTGTGMSPEVLARAFEPFFTTKQEGRGTGLGLAMVYGFAKQSGGYTMIESEPGKGTRVTLLLPRSVEAVRPATEAPVSTASAGGTERILVVEDEPFVREFVELALGRFGYRVVAVANAQAALTHLIDKNAVIDLMLTDLNLPQGMNGKQLAAEAARLRPGLPVLFASGYTEDALIRDGRLEPGQLLIPKPFDGPELARKVRQALDG